MCDQQLHELRHLVAGGYPEAVRVDVHETGEGGLVHVVGSVDVPEAVGLTEDFLVQNVQMSVDSLQDVPLHANYKVETSFRASSRQRVESLYPDSSHRGKPFQHPPMRQ